MTIKKFDDFVNESNDTSREVELALMIGRELDGDAYNVQVEDETGIGWLDDALSAFAITMGYKGEDVKLYAADFMTYVVVAMDHDKEEEYTADDTHDSYERVVDAVTTHLRNIY